MYSSQNLPLKRNGYFVIQGRKYYPEELKEKLSNGEKITMAEHRYFTQKILERKAEIEGLPTGTISDKKTDELISNSLPPLDMLTEEAKEKPKKKKKKSKKHKDKKRKKRAKRAKEAVKATLKERHERSSNLMAQHLYNKREMVLCDNQIFDYKDSIGCFNPSSEEEISRMAMSFLDEDEWLKVSYREAAEIHQLLHISNAIKKIDGFFANAPYVNCLNGVVDVCNQKLLPHSPRYFFRHCIQSNYNPDAKCKKFLEYLDYITGGNKKLIQQWRISLGYVFSHYHNAKSALLLYGIPNTGKSVMCKLIEGVIGKDYTTHIDLTDLHKQEYVAKLSGAIVNIAPDLKDEPIKDAFKEFCYEYDVKVPCDIAKFLEGHARLQKSKKRIDDDGNPISTGNPIAVYEGIRLRSKYRV